MWLCFRTTVDLFVGCHVNTLDGRTISIRLRRYIESLFVSMLHQIWNFKYSRHLKIINCVSLESFILAINLNVVSFSFFFSTFVPLYATKFFFSKKNKE